MKILIAGDSHGHSELLYALIKLHPNMDMYLHTGDLCDYQVSVFPFDVVKGNCDYDPSLMERRLIDTPYGKLLMKHIPTINKSELKKNNIKIFVFGHVHKRSFYEEDGIYYISPGSLAYERDKYNEGYLILDIDTQSVKCTFFDL